MEKITNFVDNNTKINSEQAVLKYNTELEGYLQKVKESNYNFNAKIENIRLNKIIGFLRKENRKISKAKELLRK